MILRRASLLGQSDSELVDLEIVDGLIARIEYTGHIPPAPEHEEIDLDGRVLAPGLWDEHVHLGMWAEYRRSVNLRSAASPEEAARLMAHGADSVPDTVVIGVAYRDGLWSDEKTRDLLDKHSGNRPWVLWSVDVHSCWVNTAAATLLGLEVDASGVLKEHDAFALAGRLNDQLHEVRDKWVAEALADASAKGVVGIVDFDLDDTYTNWTRRRGGASDFPVRIEAAVYPQYLDKAISRGLKTGHDIAPGVIVGPLKVITDGSLNTRTAFCVEPYLGVPGEDRGSMNYELGQLEELLRKAQAHGFRPAFHAIGDEANRIVLDLFELLGLEGRIEHAQLLREDDFPRMAAIGVVASVQPQHAIDDRDVADKFWADRTDRVIALHSMQRAGVRLAFGSDAPVSALHPMQQIAAAVTRTDDGRKPWGADQRIGVEEAFAASSRTAIERGHPADLVALGADPLWLERAFSGDPSGLYQALISIPIELTVVDGRVTHRLID